MKATDLRIGNLLYNENIIVTIDARTIFDIWDDSGLKKYKPIPLTKEILLKSGFKKIQHSFCTDISLSHDAFGCASIEYYEKENCVWLDFEGVKTGQKIYFIHELQNLYWCLCKEELQINPNT
jgi:hypothetical protein